MDSLTEGTVTVDARSIILRALKAGLGEKITQERPKTEAELKEITKKWFKDMEKKPTKKKTRKSGAGRPSSPHSIGTLKPISVIVNGGKGPSNYSRMSALELALFIIPRVVEKMAEKKEIKEKEASKVKRECKNWSVQECGKYIQEHYSRSDFEESQDDASEEEASETEEETSDTEEDE